MAGFRTQVASQMGYISRNFSTTAMSAHDDGFALGGRSETTATGPDLDTALARPLRSDAVFAGDAR